MSETANIAREIERHGEGMRILISETSRRLIDKVGGFRCESRGVLDIKVTIIGTKVVFASLVISAQGSYGDILAGWT